jgi:hypothetical protein
LGVAASAYEAELAEFAEVVGDEGLGDTERSDEVGDAGLGAGERREDAQTVFVTEEFESFAGAV